MPVGVGVFLMGREGGYNEAVSLNQGRGVIHVSPWSEKGCPFQVKITVIVTFIYMAYNIIVTLPAQITWTCYSCLVTAHGA